MLGPFVQMKRFRCLKLFAVVTLATLMAGAEAVVAQVPGLGGGSAMNGAMIALFGSNTEFTAKADIRMLNSNRMEMVDMPFNYAFSGGKMRTEIDLSQFKSAETPAPFLPAMKQFGMDQMIDIARPDKELTWSIYPHAKAYAEITNTPEERAALAAKYAFEKSPEGTENVDGHVCERSRVTLTGPKGEKTEATIWCAEDLKAFPIQMRLPGDAGGTVWIKFQNVRLTPPDAREFEPPAALTKYDSSETLIAALAKHAAATK
jgi:hypothetical protein